MSHGNVSREGELALLGLNELGGGELTLSYSPGTLTTWLLRSGNDHFGLVEIATTTVRGASDRWRVATERQRGGWRLEFRPSLRTGATASYHPRRWLPGGTLKTSDERSYTLRPAWPLRQPWEVRDQEGAVFAKIRRRSGTDSVIDLMPGSEREADALLVILAMSYATVLDRIQRVPAS